MIFRQESDGQTNKQTKVLLCSTGLCPLRGHCSAFPYSNSESCRAWVSLTTYCPWATSFWAAAPRGTKSCRTQGNFFSSICLFVRISIRLSPQALSEFALLAQKSALSGLKSALSGLKSLSFPEAEWHCFLMYHLMWNTLYKPLDPFSKQSNALKCALSGLLEIHPCVLQDISPLGLLPCPHSTPSADHFKQGIGYCWPCAILGGLGANEDQIRRVKTFFSIL